MILYEAAQDTVFKKLWKNHHIVNRYKSECRTNDLSIL